MKIASAICIVYACVPEGKHVVFPGACIFFRDSADTRRVCDTYSIFISFYSYEK